MADNPRIDDLKRRLEKEPGSRLFAQLAEELRKAGELEEAIRVCREGLEKHSSYTSARMTLGRALMDTGDLAGARGEFEAVVKAAADNILASRLLGECLEGLGDLQGAQARYKMTLVLAPGDKQVVARLEEVSARLKAPATTGAPVPPATVATPPAPASTAGAEQDEATTLVGSKVEEDLPPAPLAAMAEDESFELEAPYASPATGVGVGAAAVPTPAAIEVEESFEIEPPHAAPVPAVVPMAEPPAELVVPPQPVASAPPRQAPEPERMVFKPEEPVAASAEPVAELASSTLGELYFNQGHTAKAIEVFRQLVEREPANEQVRARLSELVAFEKHVEAEERAAAGAAAPQPTAQLDPRAARRAAIELVIGKLERLREAARRG